MEILFLLLSLNLSIFFFVDKHISPEEFFVNKGVDMLTWCKYATGIIYKYYLTAYGWEAVHRIKWNDTFSFHKNK